MNKAINSSKLLIGIFASLICATTSAGQSTAPDNSSRSPITLPSSYAIEELILDVRGDVQAIDNSRVVMAGGNIDRVVGMGPRIIPKVIEIMSADDISFDLFTRCYSICDQVLRAEDPTISSVVWFGGGITEKDKDGVERVTGNYADMDVLMFRHMIVADIKAKTRLLRKEN